MKDKIYAYTYEGGSKFWSGLKKRVVTHVVWRGWIWSWCLAYRRGGPASSTWEYRWKASGRGSSYCTGSEQITGLKENTACSLPAKGHRTVPGLNKITGLKGNTALSLCLSLSLSLCLSVSLSLLTVRGGFGGRGWLEGLTHWRSTYCAYEIQGKLRELRDQLI